MQFIPENDDSLKNQQHSFYEISKPIQTEEIQKIKKILGMIPRKTFQEAKKEFSKKQ